MSKISIKPIGDRLVVKVDEAEDKTPGGLFLPDTVKEKPLTGTIQAVGKGLFSESLNKFVKPPVKVGDRVIFGKYAGTEFALHGVDYLMMRVTDLYAVL